jgi:hypothetical protein
MKVQQLKILVAVLVLYIVISSIQRSQNMPVVINLYLGTFTKAGTMQVPDDGINAEMPRQYRVLKPRASKPLLKHYDDEPIHVNNTIDIRDHIRDYIFDFPESMYYTVYADKNVVNL